MPEKYQEVFQQIEKSQNILITFPSFWSGDAIASALAFYSFLTTLGKTASIISS